MDRQILVTGGSGYVGSHTVRALRASGLGVVVLDRVPPQDRDDIEAVVGEVADAGLLEEVFGRHRIEGVVHFAAYKSVGESMAAPGRYFDNNVAATLVLLEAMRQAGVGRIVFSSSCSVYGPPERMPVTESSAIRPESPYGASKAMVEEMLRWYDRIHDLRYVSLRYFNAAGASDDASIGEQTAGARTLIPNVMQAALHPDRPVTVHGTDYATPDGSAIRDFVHVLDLADAHVLALRHLFDGGPSRIYNLGTGHGVSVRQILDLAERVSGRSIPVRLAARRPGDPPAVWADSTTITADLGWRPTRGLDDMLGSAWRWHQREHLELCGSTDDVVGE